MALGIISLVISADLYKVEPEGMIASLLEDKRWPSKIPYEIFTALNDYSSDDPDSESTEDICRGNLTLFLDPSKGLYYSIRESERWGIRSAFLSHLSTLEDQHWQILNAAQQFLLEQETIWKKSVFRVHDETPEGMSQISLASFVVSLPKNTI